ncbi:MAG TPA: tyrosine-type recombinase/integrase [Noviherbaspirillum sp.]|jgi:integrase|uniref:tyrosine-type recombinase/integrase n=1 Tax=Noviherbaspirillum sp. TaxID=1926288 RepID=UPI002DDCE65C|nr:tyrosine-type recombinase/integrase [Noviherbaspirillum sp.]HEV2610922.1 tyrosine-type recombinase/integrase [Noviherbaspirillum sp.]
MIPGLKCSVFVIPPEEFKSGRHHVVVLNDVARQVVESCRGQHPDYVFVDRHPQKYAPADRIRTMNNTAWQNARARANLRRFRVHDMRHTFGQRLRQAGVSSEDRMLLMGHTSNDMAGLYATATIAGLSEMANAVLQDTRDTSTVLRVINRREHSRAKVAQ